MFSVLPLLDEHFTRGKPPFFSLFDANLSSSFRLAKRGTWRSRSVTASVSVICAMVVKIDPAIDNSPRILPRLSAICSPYCFLPDDEVLAETPRRVPGLSHHRRRRPLHHAASKPDKFPESSKISENFSQTTLPIFMGERRPPAKNRPPSSTHGQANMGPTGHALI
jgi:hypothetical protein